MLSPSNDIIETERLILRRPTTNDAAFLLCLVNDPSWLQYIGDRKVYTLEDARQYLLNGSIKSFNEKGFGFFVVILKETGESIGSCGLVKRDFLDDIDLGFAFFPEHTGKGYAYEAASATMAHAKHDLGIRRLAAITTQDNFPSIKLLNKLGFSTPVKFVNEGEELFLFNCDL